MQRFLIIESTMAAAGDYIRHARRDQESWAQGIIRS